MWIVMTSSARAPAARSSGTRYGVYRNIALVNVNPLAPIGWSPPRIDSRIKLVLEVRHWGKYYVGKSAKAAYQRTLDEAIRRAKELNDGH